MKFRFVRKVDHPVKTYQGQTVSTGEEIEFTGPFIEKALSHPDYEAVQEQKTVQKRAKKKVSRKRASKKKARAEF